MNYEKGEKLKDINELLDILRERKAYYCGDALYKNDIDLYYCINGEMWEECFHAIPKREKKKYWLWSFCDKNSEWWRSSVYMDKDGVSTNGEIPKEWVKVEKIKHENEFIEV